MGRSPSAGRALRVALGLELGRGINCYPGGAFVQVLMISSRYLTRGSIDVDETAHSCIHPLSTGHCPSWSEARNDPESEILVE